MKARIISDMTPRPEPEDGLMAVTCMLQYVKEHFCLPGQIENWVILMDLDNLSLKNIPYKTLGVFLENL